MQEKKQENTTKDQIEKQVINKPIPAWVKGLVVFWSEGGITDDEFKEAIRFLVNNNIIVL